MINTQLVHVNKLAIDGNTDCNIVQLSDIHIGSVSSNFLKEIIEKTNSLNPDLILITGDCVDNFNNSTQEAIASFKNFKAPVVFSTGNHETYVGADRVTEALRAANVTVLRNQMMDFGQIRIIGIDNGTNRDRAAQIIREFNTDRSKFCILMHHQPTDLKLFSDGKVNLTLSGHTHYGQIFPFNYIVRLFYDNISGLHEYPGGCLYISSGAGTWGPRMRLGSRSEIVSIQIKKATD
jgi:predicted MPP superfamily phosphohydrolase